MMLHASVLPDPCARVRASAYDSKGPMTRVVQRETAALCQARAPPGSVPVNVQH